MASSSKHSAPPASENEQRGFHPTSYTVGWISALPNEFKAAQAMLDERHKPPETRNGNDSNTYVLGKIGKHNVVMACLPAYGVVRAAIAASTMRSSFPQVQFGLMVGIGGGIPSEEKDIRLGDVVVSKPTGEHGGVIQYDLGKMEKDGFRRVGSLNKPPYFLITAVNTLAATYDLEARISALAIDSFKPLPNWAKEFKRPASFDRLFEPGFEHASNNRTCESCDKSREIVREERPDPESPQIHYGNIASGNSVVKNAHDRDLLAKRDDAICFDMEAAGLMDEFHCLVVRGICDYSDSHKNKNWQPYAAAVAAAYAKELLLQVPPEALRPKKLLLQVLPEAVKSLRPIQNVHWVVPKSVNPFFTGRERILRKLGSIFCQPRDEKDSVQKRFVIHGIGGAGKSEVCVRFAHDKKNNFWGIFWVDATTTESVRRGMIRAAMRACNGSIEDFEDAKTKFSNIEYSWLLILDNADDPEINYEQYFPTGNTGNIIVTTRNHDCIKYGTAGHETFEKLDLEDAVELLLKSSGIRKEYWDKNKAEASKVAQLLAQHALAITQAGASISQGILKLESYCRAFHAQRKEMLTNGSIQGQSTYDSVYATFEVSATAMKNSQNGDWKKALALLQILGYFYRDNLSEEIFTRAWIHAFVLSTREPHDHIMDLTMWHVNHLRRILPSQASNPEEALMSLRRARQVLRSFSLVSFDPQTSAISMHPLAHTWARDRLQHQDQISAWATASSILALSVFKLGYRNYFGSAQAHFEQCFNLRPEPVFEGLPGLEICRILYSFWRVFLWMGTQQIHKISFLLRSRIGTEILPLSQNSREIHYISTISLRNQNRNTEAMGLLQEIVTFDNKLKNKGLLLQSQLELARVLFALGRFHDSLNRFKRLFRLGKVSEHQYEMLQGLARSYEKIGNSRKAMKLFKAVRAEMCKTRITDAYSFVFYELSTCYEDSGKFKEAIVCMQYALHIHKKALLYMHEYYFRWYATLARLYEEDGQPQKAAALLQKVISNRENKVESENACLLNARLCLAAVYHKLGHPLEALPILQEVARIGADTLPPNFRTRFELEKSVSICLALIEQNTSEDGVYIPSSNAESLDNLPDIDPDNLSDVHTPDISDYSSFEISDPSDDSEPESSSESHSLRLSDSKWQAEPGDSTKSGRELAFDISSMICSCPSQDSYLKFHISGENQILLGPQAGPGDSTKSGRELAFNIPSMICSCPSQDSYLEFHVSGENQILPGPSREATKIKKPSWFQKRLSKLRK